MELCDMYENWYPEHSRSSCSDEHPINADVDGSGCHRCNAIRFEQNEERGKRIEALEAEITGWKQDQKDNHKIQIDQHQQILALKAENLKLKEWIEEASHRVWCMRLDVYDDRDHGCTCGKEALSTPSDTTALTEYRNGVIEECAVLLDKMDSQYFDGYEFRHVLPEDCAEDLRAMKEKP